MQKRIVTCVNQGMSRDISISQLNEKEANYAFENHNIRITAVNDNTLYTVTNEKGTKNTGRKLNGVFLGSCILNNYIIVFTKNNNQDNIYRIHYDKDTDTYQNYVLFRGDLGFDLEHPIDAIGYYESEEVQKVYWVDGINPNRFINIVDNSLRSRDKYQFDFQGHINSIPNISITKNYNKSGTFQAGIIQYFATYYNKYGTETCITWQSDLQYISMEDRGAKPDEYVSCAFDFTISNIDTSYDYIRIYAAYRTGLNSTAEGRIVAELETSDTVLSFSDYGTNYQNYNAEDIHYLGGQNIIASTLDYKQDTLFLGDIKLDNTQIPKDHLLYASLKNCTYEYIEDQLYINSCNDITFQYKELPSPDIKGVYSYQNQLSNPQKDIAGFKHREIYRFAIQFMTVTGEWTTPIYIGDKYCDLPPILQEDKDNQTQTYKIAQAVYTMNTAAKNNLAQWNKDNPGREFIQIRLVVAEMDNESRRILAQGVVNPTMFNYYDRQLNRPYSINSWLFRPRKSNIVNKHYDCMYTQDSDYAEIQGITERKSPSFNPYNQSGEKNSYALAIALHGDWITGHELTYQLFKYASDGGINTITWEGEEYLCDYERGQSDHNSNIEVITNSTLSLSDDERKKLNNKDKVRQWLIDELVGNGIDVSDEMIPTGQQFKDMRRANSITENPDLLWGIIGAALVTVAGVVASVFSFGAATAPAVTATTLLWSSLLAGIGTTAAVAGSAGVATIAEQFKDAPDIDYQFAKKGFYCLLPNLVHTNANAKEYKKQYEDWRNNLFGDKCKPSEGINSMDAGSAVVVTRIGRTTFLSPRELNARNKRDQYYIDESVITLNSPDIEDVQYAIDNSKALRLDLVGTIPITSSHSESLMYAQQGVGNNSQTIPTVISNAYPSYNIEGLLNGGLYQDILLESFIYNTNKENGKIGWPDIEPTDLMSLYKIFMWNRETSWSCYIPGINIIDPVQLNDETISYLQYIPAVPIKKIFSNLKYSHNTVYQPFYTLDIEQPKVYTDSEFKLLQFNSNNQIRNYYGTVEQFMTNEEGYVLLQSNNSPLWEQPDDQAHQLKVYDPIGIKYKSTSHAIVPLKWESSQQVILPYIQNEHPVNLADIYNDITKHSIIEGATSNKNLLKVVCLPSYSDTEEDPLNELSDGETVDSAIIEHYALLLGEQILGTTLLNAIKSKISEHSYTYECATHSGIVCENTQVVTVVAELPDRYTNDFLDEIKHSVFDKIGNDIKYINSDFTKYIIFEDNTWKCYDVKNQMPIIQTITASYNIYEFLSSVNKEFGDELHRVIETIIRDKYDEVFYAGLTYEEFLNGYYDDNGIWVKSQHPIADEIKEKLPCKPYAMDVNSRYKSYIDENWENIPEYLTVELIDTQDAIITFIQQSLKWEESNPYLFIGEFVKKDFDYDSWLGGNSDFALQQLNWNICSNSYNINQTIDKTWGDTYYQRWDCLKTYPTTEQDKNSIVEVLSFMVESHTNLDGRSDVNRGIHNLINLRPSNTNLFNPVYNQQDNFFSYKILDEKFDKNVFRNQVVWSLSKINLDNIDKWTDIHAVNSLQLDGKLGSINKIINMNDTLLAFQDTGISTIDYNLKSALTTYEGVPLQMGNTGKVTGYTKVTSDIGCHNKWAMCLTDAGIFFIDSYRKSLYMMSPNTPPVDISKKGYFSTWFKDNINNKIWNPIEGLDAFRLNYDSSTQDLYISNDNTCLLYNVGLQSFTSFMDYVSTPLLIHMQGNSLAFNQYINNMSLWLMFQGEYDNIYGINRNYSIEYRLNPSPYTDNMFTNYQYVADWTKSSTKSNDFEQFDSNRFDHFDTVKAWNEYQLGELDATTGTGIQPIKTKFRIWKGDIPRNGDTKSKRILKGDRMRNPWIHLKFTKDTINNTKMTFHNLNVTYYN